MSRILLISPLDRRTVPNTREENMAREFRAMGHETLSLNLAQNTSRSLSAVVRDACTSRVLRDKRSGVTVIDPLFNPCTGLQSNLQSAPVSVAASEAKPFVREQAPTSGQAKVHDNLAAVHQIDASQSVDQVMAYGRQAQLPTQPPTQSPRGKTNSKQSAAKRLRSWLVAVLSPLGVLRDVAVVPAFLIHALRCGRFDVCVAYGPWAAAVGWCLRSLGRVDVLIYDDQDFEPAVMRNATRKRWAAWLEKVFMQRANEVVSVGHRLAALREQQTGRSVTVIPNGVNEASFELAKRPLAQAAPAVRPFTLIYVGNVVPWSGLDLMLDAWPALCAAAPNLRLLIVGDGLPSYVQMLKDRSAELNLQLSASKSLHTGQTAKAAAEMRVGIGAKAKPPTSCETSNPQPVESSTANQIQFIGRVPHAQIHRWLAQADVGLAHFRPEPYRRYAFPLKVVEYMAAGLAVIGTCDTETEDILARHGAGLSVAFDAQQLTQAVLTMVQQPQLLKSFQERAAGAAQNYRWKALAAEQWALMQGQTQALKTKSMFLPPSLMTPNDQPLCDSHSGDLQPSPLKSAQADRHLATRVDLS